MNADKNYEERLWALVNFEIWQRQFFDGEVLHASDPSRMEIGKADMTFNDAVPVVIPSYNEERFILKALKQLVDRYDRDRYEIIIADGLSAVRELRQARPAGMVKSVYCAGAQTNTRLSWGSS